MREMSKTKQNKGFTLAELLVVVAIIGVLIATAIPVFSDQLEKSREATDAANIRAAYAEVAMNAIDLSDPCSKDVDLKQKKDGWQNSSMNESLLAIASVSGTPTSGGKATVTYSNGTFTISFEGSSSDPTPPTYYDPSWTINQKAVGLGEALKDLLSNFYIDSSTTSSIISDRTYSLTPAGYDDEQTLDAKMIWFDDIYATIKIGSKDNPGTTTTTSLANYLTDMGVDVATLYANSTFKTTCTPIMYLSPTMDPIAVYYRDPDDKHIGYMYYLDGSEPLTIAYKNNGSDYYCEIDRKDGAWYAVHKDEAIAVDAAYKASH